MAVLEFNNVTKTYNAKSGSKRGPLTAVKAVSFTVEAGEVVGFIGPNGAGKSTAIKMITGLA
ncbi:ATP-binding cassette domain-containing protein, partial [bacterium]|nr:ATP-binding cassette domain-containing protein [bacterium]